MGLRHLRPEAVRLLLRRQGENTTAGDIEWGVRRLARRWPTAAPRCTGAAWCLRYKPEDFRLRTNTGEGADWPITYDDLEPYYCQAEDYLSVCGDVHESWNRHRADRPYPRPTSGGRPPTAR